MKRVGIFSLYTKVINIEIFETIRWLGKCTIWLDVREKTSHRMETEMLVFQSSGFRSVTLETRKGWKMKNGLGIYI